MPVTSKKYYFGAANLLTSTANKEIIQQWTPNDWVNVKIKAYDFDFINYQDCHIKINGDTNQIFLPANEGFRISTKRSELAIEQFTIVEAGINYWYKGCYHPE